MGFPLGRPLLTHAQYWTSTVSNATDPLCSPDSDTIDLWRDGRPARERRSAWAGVYEEEIFLGEAARWIAEAAQGTRPLFLYYASHLSHTPMQVPQPTLDRFLNESAHLSLPGVGYAAMTGYLDLAVANVTAALRAHGLWSNTIFVFQSVSLLRSAVARPLRRRTGQWRPHLRGPVQAHRRLPQPASPRHDGHRRQNPISRHVPRLWGCGLESSVPRRQGQLLGGRDASRGLHRRRRGPPCQAWYACCRTDASVPAALHRHSPMRR